MIAGNSFTEAGGLDHPLKKISYSSTCGRGGLMRLNSSQHMAATDCVYRFQGTIYQTLTSSLYLVEKQKHQIIFKEMV